jgi:hypothetical protein
VTLIVPSHSAGRIRLFRCLLKMTKIVRRMNTSQVRQEGYALMLAVFLAALLAVSVAATAPNALMQGRREKEQEMVWRGNQYVRGIRLFYRKNHRIPGTLEELFKPQLGVRYMRKAYTDPMNSVDGSWRLIQIGPAGQLIGSTHPNTVFRIGVPGGGSSAVTTSTDSGLRGGGRSSDLSNTDSSSFHQNPSASPDTTNDASTSASSSTQAASDSPVFGSSIIGIGSKAQGRSILWLDGAKNYRDFEFIWDPSKDNMGVNAVKLLNAPSDSVQQPTVPFGGQANGLRSNPQPDPNSQ